MFLPDQLIKSEWVEAAFARGANPVLKGRPRALGVDVARYGDDETVLAETEGWHLVSIDSFKGIDTHRTSELAKSRIVVRDIPAYMVRVDTVGLGAGVADTLFASKLRITEFVAGAKPIGTHKHLKFKNLRSEAWWNLRELLCPSKENTEALISFSPQLSEDHRYKLMADLTAQRYSVDSDKVIEVRSKDEIKSELKRSPDVGDAVMQAFARMGGGHEFLSRITTR
jgi:hypothetical protein